MQNSRLLTAGAALALATLCFAWPHPAQAALRAGDKAPPFTLKTIDKGEPRALDALTKDKKTKGVVLVFLSCKCPYVVQARQPLAELAKQYGDKVQFVGINSNQNETAEDIKADAALNFPFPMLRDDSSKIADAYAAERTPEIFLVDGKGVIQYKGGITDLGAALGEFTAGKPLSKPESKAFGCTIKRKP
jgi:peroxiredoxin